MTTPNETVQIQKLPRIVMQFPIKGTSPLIAHKWAEKAKGMMRDKQTGSTVKAKKEAKDPLAEFNAARYRLADGRDGMPATAFKAAIADAARLFDKSVTMTMLKVAVYVLGEGPEQLVPIEYEELTMREDMPRNATGVCDLRYRPMYWPWTATLHVQVVGGQLDHGSVLALVDAAGLGGVGDWRPSAPKSKSGTFGCWEAVTSESFLLESQG